MFDALILKTGIAKLLLAGMNKTNYCTCAFNNVERNAMKLYFRDCITFLGHIQSPVLYVT